MDTFIGIFLLGLTAAGVWFLLSRLARSQYTCVTCRAAHFAEEEVYRCHKCGRAFCRDKTMLHAPGADAQAGEEYFSSNVNLWKDPCGYEVISAGADIITVRRTCQGATNRFILSC